MGWLDKLFGNYSQKEIDRHQKTVALINQLEPKYEKMSDEKLTRRTKVFRKKLADGAKLDDLIPDAFAAVREASRRNLKMRHFDVQLIGALILNEGKIAEMKTGEGKTLVATLALYLNALEGKGAHLVTVNDYLAKRDAEWMGRVYHALGMTTGIIQNQGVSYIFDPNYKPEKDETADGNTALVHMDNLRPCDRRIAYAADITYGTNNEFGFDYLRDNMARDPKQLAQRDLHFAIVDEVDSILIDEARTPLIISAPAEQSAAMYSQFASIVPRLKAEEDYEVDEKDRAVSITEKGLDRVEKALGIKGLYDVKNITLVHHLEEALKANILFKRDRDYVVKDGEVVIVDEFTGRMMPGRRYSEGLHQAIEAKEGVQVQHESQTMATISFQNLFRIYKKLSGMTGTALTEAEEFSKIYKLEVVPVPTNKPMIRQDLQDKIYKTEMGKFKAIVDQVFELNKKGQPILIGTVSITKSEILSKLLRQRGIKHEVLNAKHHEQEAQIISQAGRLGAVTVATNMAGRGVDIILGGIPKKKSERDKVEKLGGLCVIGSERHESRRIDNQLRGRSGRQGDNGLSMFYISLEDDLMRIFGGERLKGIMDKLGLQEDQPIEHSMISKSVESAQRRVEGHNFDIRKHLVEYDDVMNKHREVVYARRRKILFMDPIKEEWLHQQVLELLDDEGKKALDKKIKEYGIETIHQAERAVYLGVIDRNWVNHLNTMDSLRDSIGLRGYGQVDPLVVYKQEAFKLFEAMLRDIDDQVVDILSKLEIQSAPQQPPMTSQPLRTTGANESLSGGAIQSVPNSEGVIAGGESTNMPTVSPSSAMTSAPQPMPKSDVTVTVRGPAALSSRPVQSPGVSNNDFLPKVGRNDPCPCGAVKPDGTPIKYKNCHGKNQ